MAFFCPIRIRRNKKKHGHLESDLLSGTRHNHQSPIMGRITGSASIETLVRVGIEKENGLSPNSKMIVLHDFTPCVDDELEVKRGQIINILYQENDWVYVISTDQYDANGQLLEGFIPASYCAPLIETNIDNLLINFKKKLPRNTINKITNDDNNINNYKNDDINNNNNNGTNFNVSNFTNTLMNDFNFNNNINNNNNNNGWNFISDTIDNIDLNQNIINNNDDSLQNNNHNNNLSSLDFNDNGNYCNQIVQKYSYQNNISSGNNNNNNNNNHRQMMDNIKNFSLNYPNNHSEMNGNLSINETMIDIGMQHQQQQQNNNNNIMNLDLVMVTSSINSTTPSATTTTSVATPKHPTKQSYLTLKNLQSNNQQKFSTIISDNVQPFYKNNYHDQQQQQQYSRYVMLYTFIGRDENDLSCERGEIITILNNDDNDWFWVMRTDSQEGFVPASFIYPVDLLLNTHHMHQNNTIQSSKINYSDNNNNNNNNNSSSIPYAYCT